MAYPNFYAGYCKTCRQHVAAKTGYWHKATNSVYCPLHVPEQITAPQQIRRELTLAGEVYTPYEKDNLPLLRAMPGARWNPEKKAWTVSTLMADRPRVLELADKLGLAVPDAMRAIPITNRAAAAAAVAGAYPFQVDGVQFLSLGTKRILGDEMGLGKTIQALLGLPEKEACRALVVCPKIVKYNWQDEAKKWRPDLTPVVLSGKDGFRWPQAGELLIINYDVLPDWLKTDKKTYELLVPAAEQIAAKGVVAIFDEAHLAKNYKALRSQRVKALSRIVTKVWALSGTPLLNRPGDLYGVLESFDMAREVFGGWKKFTELYGAYKGKWGGWIWGSPSPEVPERLRRVMLRRTRAEVLPNLPKKIYTTITVNGLNAALNRKLDELWEEWGDAVETSEELPPFEEFSRIRAELAAARIPAVEEYVEENEEQEVPLVVFSAHRAPVDTLGAREGWAAITGDTSPEARQDIIRRFQAGELKGVALTIAAGGVGITLTRAWRVLFVDLDWTPANNAQAEDRLARIGQEADHIEVVRMVSDHPLDKRINNLLASKIAMIFASIDATTKGKIPAVLPPVRGAVETEEQFKDRLARAWAEAEERERLEREELIRRNKDVAKARAAGIHARLTAKGIKPLPLTDERIAAVRRAFDAMLANDTDMAFLRNGVGFNKPDSYVAHMLMTAGLETNVELEAGQIMLMKYRGQLEGQFPVLFKE